MKLILKILNDTDVNQFYLKWFENLDVVRYSDNQYRSFTFKKQLEYVKNCFYDDNINLYGIFDDNTHIGNIKINGIKSIHKRAEITYVIGNTKYWGKGVASFAVSKMIEISKTKYYLNKLFAGVADENLGSIKVLEKNGFILEGKRSKHLYFNGKFHDQLDYGLLL